MEKKKKRKITSAYLARFAAMKREIDEAVEQLLLEKQACFDDEPYMFKVTDWDDWAKSFKVEVWRADPNYPTTMRKHAVHEFWISLLDGREVEPRKGRPV